MNSPVMRDRGSPGRMGGRDNLIRLSDWRGQWEESVRPRPERSRRPRRSHRREELLTGGEWVATLSVIAAMAVLVGKLLSL